MNLVKKEPYLTMEDAVTVGEILLLKLKAQERDKAGEGNVLG